MAFTKTEHTLMDIKLSILCLLSPITEILLYLQVHILLNYWSKFNSHVVPSHENFRCLTPKYITSIQNFIKYAPHKKSYPHKHIFIIMYIQIPSATNFFPFISDPLDVSSSTEHSKHPFHLLFWETLTYDTSLMHCVKYSLNPDGIRLPQHILEGFVRFNLS